MDDHADDEQRDCRRDAAGQTEEPVAVPRFTHPGAGQTIYIVNAMHNPNVVAELAALTDRAEAAGRQSPEDLRREMQGKVWRAVIAREALEVVGGGDDVVDEQEVPPGHDGRGGEGSLHVPGAGGAIGAKAKALKAKGRDIMSGIDSASRSQAEEFVSDSDRLRREFVESTYGKQWDAVTAFDLVIDTRKISPEMAVDWLEAAARRLNSPQPGQAPTARALEIDPVLAGTVAEVLDRQMA